jgi:hypothetical protein
MADLIVFINEKITLNNNDRGVLTTQTISDVNNIDNRLLTIPTGSHTGLFYFDPSNIGAASYLTGSLKYSRITNKSTVPIQLVVSMSDGNYSDFIVTPGSSFFLSSTSSTGSLADSTNFTFDTYITEVLVSPSGSSASIEYFIATT